jgi:ribosomal-protein-alanine N-acetyltransferase
MAYNIDNLVIRDAEPFDTQAIRLLAFDTKIDAWTEADYSDEISRLDSIFLKAMEDGTLVGFLVARIVPGTTERPDAELYNIAVLPTRKRQGIGNRLIVALSERLVNSGVSNVWLEVRESNSEAIAFYRSHGFRSEITRANFYANPTENAIIMRFRIGTGPDVSEA